MPLSIDLLISRSRCGFFPGGFGFDRLGSGVCRRVGSGCACRGSRLSRQAQGREPALRPEPVLRPQVPVRQVSRRRAQEQFRHSVRLPLAQRFDKATIIATAAMPIWTVLYINCSRIFEIDNRHASLPTKNCADRPALQGREVSVRILTYVGKVRILRSGCRLLRPPPEVLTARLTSATHGETGAAVQIAPVPSATFTRRPGSVTPPLTHHEILRLIAPFTRRGHHADLGASDRSERRLAFKPIEHEAESPALTGLCETLQLENPRSETYRLIRTLTLRSGLTATLRIDGTDPAELLAGIETVSPPRQFVAVAGHLIAKSYRLETTTHKPLNDAPALRMLLISAEARVDGLTLLLKAETGKGYPAEITLRPVADGTLDLPDDLLAALGWDWGVLRPRGKEWMAMLKAPGREPRRSRRIELRLEQTVSASGSDPCRTAAPVSRAADRCALGRRVPTHDTIVVLCWIDRGDGGADVAQDPDRLHVPDADLQPAAAIADRVVRHARGAKAGNPAAATAVHFDRMAAGRSRRFENGTRRGADAGRQSWLTCPRDRGPMPSNPMNIPPVSISAAKSSLDRAIFGSRAAPACLDVVGHP